MKVYLNENRVSFGFDESQKQIEKEMELIEKFIYFYDKLDDYERFNLLKYFYSFYLEDNDFIKLINLKYNKNFEKIISIPTKMEYESIDQEGHGKDFSWWNVKNRLILRCVTYNNFTLEVEKYSYDEIINFINQGEIYPIFIFSEEINQYSQDKEECKIIKTFVPYEIKIEKVYLDEYSFIVDIENVNIIMEMIKKELNPGQIFIGIKSYFQDLIQEFHRVEWLCTSEERMMLPKIHSFYKDNFKDIEKIKKFSNKAL